MKQEKNIKTKARKLKDAKNSNKGITLIALVITIVVLLILAAISIATLTGQNGILTRANEAKDNTEQARLEELVDLAITSLIAKNNGDRSTIFPENIANEINSMENRTDVYAEGNAYPTNIVFPNDNNRKVEVIFDIFEDILEDLEKDPNKYYEQAQELGQTTNQDIGIGTDGKVVNLDLWRYYKTDDGEGMSLGKQDFSLYYSGYIGDIENGKILGEVPQYIYLKDEQKIYAVIQLGPMFYNRNRTDTVDKDSEKIVEEIPKLPSTIESFRATFRSCSKITHVDANVFSMVNDTGVSTFLECTALTDVEIPYNVTTIGMNTFGLCTALTNITIPENITTIRSEAFILSGLTEITIPKSVTTVEPTAFLYCNALENLTLATNVQVSAFAYCGLKNVVILDGVTAISGATFGGCTSLESITIPKSLTSIGESAFAGCEKLNKINYEGTAEDWAKIEINTTGNEVLNNATINYNYIYNN